MNEKRTVREDYASQYNQSSLIRMGVSSTSPILFMLMLAYDLEVLLLFFNLLLPNSSFVSLPLGKIMTMQLVFSIPYVDKLWMEIIRLLSMIRYFQLLFV